MCIHHIISNMIYDELYIYTPITLGFYVICNVFCNVARNMTFFNGSIKKLNGLLSLTLNRSIDLLKTVCNVTSYGLS